MEYEKVFEYGGEGGSICITRRKSDSGEKFIFHKSEINFTDEEFDEASLSETVCCNSFDEAFELNNRYPWHSLYFLLVHDDYRNIIIQKFLAKLNEESTIPEEISWSSQECLKIKLKHKISKRKNTWSYEDHVWI